MAFKWTIKRIKDDPITVSETVGKQALAAWEAGFPVIKLPNDISISSGTITGIEPTYKAQEEDAINLIASGKMKKAAMLDLEDNVVTSWFKREVGQTAWEKHYAALPNYYRLVDDSKSTWIAMRLPSYTNDLSRSAELVPCEEHEVRLLEQMRETHVGA